MVEQKAEVVVNDKDVSVLVKYVNQKDPEAPARIFQTELDKKSTVQTLVDMVNQTVQDEAVLIFKGHELDVDKTLEDYKITSLDKILAVYGKDRQSEGGSGAIQFYMRFPTLKEGEYWQTGRGDSYWDAICFVPKMNVKVMGVAIYKIYQREDRFSYGIRYKVED